MLHGVDAAKAAEQTAQKTFEQGGTAAGLPTFEVPVGDLENISATEAGVLTGLCASNGEAKRHIKAGALKINDEKTTDGNAKLSASDVNADGVIKISVGKKKHALIKPV